MTLPFKILGVDHIAIAVKKMEAASDLWSSLLGGLVPHQEQVPGQGVDVAMFPVSGGAKIELITPSIEGSPIDQFLAKRGEGIHHICLRVDNAQAAWDHFSSEAIPLLGNGPQPGAEESLIFFLHPRAANGVLVEIRESNS